MTPAPASSVMDAPAIALRPRIERFGRYRLLAEMGHGGMADVFLAVTVGPAGFSKLQVIKRLRESLAEDPELQAMLLDEARLAAQLNHRNVVQTLEVGCVEDRYFLAMELLDGQPYSRITRRCRAKGEPLPLPLAVKVLSEVLAGLHYAHEAKDYEGRPLSVVHRDVSPQNVFVTYDGQVKVMDFGIAKAARRIVETQTGTVRGKVGYMAPEQSLPKTDALDHRADVFSVGVMLWEELAGARMWAGKADPEILLKLSSVGVPKLPERADIPAELARICARATALDRDDRYATAASMRADLEAYLTTAGEPASLEALGERLSGLFAEDRARMQKIVERQLGALRETEMDETSHPRAPMESELTSAELSASGDRPRTTARDARSASSRDARSASSRDARSASSRDARPSASLPREAALSAEGTPSGQRAGSASERRAVGPRSRAWLLAGAGFLAAVGLLVARDHFSARLPADASALAGESGHADAPAASASEAASSSAAASSGAAAASASAVNTIRVRIAATPPGARISIDGIAVPANPFEGTLVKDVAMHRLVIEAPGFLPHGRMLAFDRDVDLEVPLRPRGKPPGPGAPVPQNPALPPLKPR